jgi:hypothetical protein
MRVSTVGGLTARTAWNIGLGEGARAKRKSPTFQRDGHTVAAEGLKSRPGDSVAVCVNEVLALQPYKRICIP